MRRVLLLVACVAVLGGTAEGARAQFGDPCNVGCALVLGGASYAFAMGTVTAVGRLNGGFSTAQEGIVTWALGFGAAAGAGMALSTNGGRQERAVYGAGIGAVAGGLVGLAFESVGESSKATRLAATLIGSAVGVLAGGVIGATTWEPERGRDVPQAAVIAPGVSFALRF